MRWRARIWHYADRNMRILIVLAISLVSATAAADTFMQARCEQHASVWHGPKRAARSQRAFRDADAHNRSHRGHDARVLVVAHEST